MYGFSLVIVKKQLVKTITTIVKNVTNFSDHRQRHRIASTELRSIGSDRSATADPLIASIHSNRLSSNRRKPNSSETTTNLFFSFLFSSLRCRITSSSLDGTSDASKPTRSALMTRKHPSPRHYNSTTSGIGSVRVSLRLGFW